MNVFLYGGGGFIGLVTGGLRMLGIDVTSSQVEAYFSRHGSNFGWDAIVDFCTGGGHTGGGAAAVPELDGSLFGFALLLVVGGMAVIHSRRRSLEQ